MNKKLNTANKDFLRKAYSMMTSLKTKKIVLISPFNKEVREKMKFLIDFLKSQ